MKGEYNSKERNEYIRLNELETYFSIQKSPDMTIIGLAIIAGLYLDPLIGGFIIGLSLLKMFILTVYSLIERKLYETSAYPVGTRIIQFWMYRFIFLLQLLLLLWILFKMMSIKKD